MPLIGYMLPGGGVKGEGCADGSCCWVMLIMGDCCCWPMPIIGDYYWPMPIMEGCYWPMPIMEGCY